MSNSNFIISIFFLLFSTTIDCMTWQVSRSIYHSKGLPSCFLPSKMKKYIFVCKCLFSLEVNFTNRWVHSFSNIKLIILETIGLLEFTPNFCSSCLTQCAKKLNRSEGTKATFGNFSVQNLNIKCSWIWHQISFAALVKIRQPVGQYFDRLSISVFIHFCLLHENHRDI